MMYSESPCELCGENMGTNVWYNAHAKSVTVSLCSQCRSSIEEKDGLTHHFVAHHCPTCNHRTFLRFVKYNENDIEARMCSECRQWFHRRNSDMHEEKVQVKTSSGTKTLESKWVCDECYKKQRDRFRNGPTKDGVEVVRCPKCERATEQKMRTKPNGKVVVVDVCWFCDYESDERVIMKQKVNRPAKVAELKV